jgi:hypothetical protein
MRRDQSGAVVEVEPIFGFPDLELAGDQAVRH